MSESEKYQVRKATGFQVLKLHDCRLRNFSENVKLIGNKTATRNVELTSYTC